MMVGVEYLRPQTFSSSKQSVKFVIFQSIDDISVRFSDDHLGRFN
jgi:hypothetical protein